jgi:ribosomal protein S18 acetylase RimI-like enzyme
MKIRKARLEDVAQLAPLFDAYRRFYQQPGDPEGAAEFLHQRLNQQESVIFVAESDDGLQGFTQLYPSFSSVSMQRLWILNDLYVDDRCRQSGVASALMDQARDWAVTTGAKGIILETDWDNVQAQALYRKLGYEQQNSTYHYFLPTGPLEQSPD